MLKKYHLIVIYLIVLNSADFIFGHNPILLNEFGDFAEATSFSISPAGFIYVTDAGTNELIKLDTLGNVLIKRGGYGWTNATFDYPSHVFTQTLRISVADKNNHRIQFFDKDLTFLSAFKTSETEDEQSIFQYPIASVISNQGDLFILDSDNSRVLKYDFNGSYIQDIGNFDSGNYSLSDPKSFAVTPGGNLMVLDNNEIIIFDQYGAGLQKFETGFETLNLNITFSKLVLNNSHKIKYADLKSTPVKFKEFLLPDEKKDINIVEALIYWGKVYILTENNILVYKITSHSK